jgi:2-methylcitrate dehydratase PrpD
MTDLAVRLGAWAAGLPLSDIPAPVQRGATRCIRDVVGVAIAGAATDAASRVRRHVAEAYGSGSSRILGTSATSSPLGAALAVGMAAHVLDYDDTCYAGIVHGSAAVFPAALAAGEATGIGGAELLAAFIAGCEVEYAVGRALGSGVYRWWTTALLGTIGAAAGAARALRLDAQTTANAIRIAACESSGLRRVFGTPAKPYLCGRAAQAGLDAALAARSGLTGPDEVLEGPDGFFDRFGDNAPEPNAFAELGQRFALADPGIAFKLYPVCSAAQAAIEGTAGLIAEHRISPAAIARVRCEVTPFVASCLTYPRPRTVEEMQFSMPFAIGCILGYGSLDVRYLDPRRVADPVLERAMAKVEMTQSDVVGDEGAHLEAAAVTLHLEDGRELRRHVPAATGTPSRPASDEQLYDKFRLCVASVISPVSAASLWRRIGAIAEIPSIDVLFDRPLPTVTEPFARSRTRDSTARSRILR